MKSNLMLVLASILAFLISFALMTGLVWVICWAFGFDFSVRECVGVYVLCLIAKQIIQSLRGRKK